MLNLRDEILDCYDLREAFKLVCKAQTNGVKGVEGHLCGVFIGKDRVNWVDVELKGAEWVRNVLVNTIYRIDEEVKRIFEKGEMVHIEVHNPSVFTFIGSQGVVCVPLISDKGKWFGLIVYKVNEEYEGGIENNTLAPFIDLLDNINMYRNVKIALCNKETYTCNGATLSVWFKI